MMFATLRRDSEGSTGRIRNPDQNGKSFIMVIGPDPPRDGRTSMLVPQIPVSVTPGLAEDQANLSSKAYSQLCSSADILPGPGHEVVYNMGPLLLDEETCRFNECVDGRADPQIRIWVPTFA